MRHLSKSLTLSLLTTTAEVVREAVAQFYQITENNVTLAHMPVGYEWAYRTPTLLGVYSAGMLVHAHRKQESEHEPEELAQAEFLIPNEVFDFATPHLRRHILTYLSELRDDAQKLN